MATFRPGEYNRLLITVDDGPDVEMVFGFVDYETAAIHFVVEGVDLPIVIDRDTLAIAVIQGWDGQFDDIHADPVPIPHVDFRGANGPDEEVTDA